MTKRNGKKSGIEQGEVGPGRPPKQHRFKPGVSGNPKGKPKGLQDWSTIVRKILGSEELFEAILAHAKEKPGWVNQLGGGNKNAAHAVVMAMIKKALDGDHKAADFLRKTGFGDKIDLTSGGEPIQALVEFVGDAADQG